jgi:hypothetical protein
MIDDDLMDLFAGLAMQGYLTQSYVQNQECIARDSYSMAEAMLKEKEKRRGRTQQQENI